MANLPMPEGLDSSKLECVMLDLPPFDIHEAFGPDLKEKHLFYGDVPELKYAQGAVAEKSAHVTLLFGIHPSETYVDDVYAALGEDFEIPQILIRKVGYFPSRVEGQKYNCIVGEVVPTPQLREANRRLATLPHTDKFPMYKPHVTLAYIKEKANLERWVSRLNVHYANTVHTPSRLNLGLDDES